jgi:hypothetical protein
VAYAAGFAACKSLDKIPQPLLRTAATRLCQLTGIEKVNEIIAWLREMANDQDVFSDAGSTSIR